MIITQEALEKGNVDKSGSNVEKGATPALAFTGSHCAVRRLRRRQCRRRAAPWIAPLRGLAWALSITIVASH